MYHIKIDKREALSGKFSGSAKSEIKEELAKTGLMRTTIKRPDILNFWGVLKNKMALTVFAILFFFLMPGSIFAANQSKTPSNASGTNWTTPANITDGSNDTWATYNTTTQDWLKVTNFGFSIPDGATIKGVTVKREGHGHSAYDAAAREYQMALTKDGSTVTGTSKTALALPDATDNVVNVGGATDMWGATLSTTEVNSSNFGILIRDDDTTATELAFDAMTVTITYSLTTDYEITSSDIAFSPTDPGLNEVFTISATVKRTGDGGILVYSDLAPKYEETALGNLGYSYTTYDTVAPFRSALTGDVWDIAIVNCYNLDLTADGRTDIDNYINNKKGRVVINDWGAYNNGDAAALWVTLKADMLSDYTAPVPIYKWKDHLIMTTPNAIPSKMTNTHDPTNRDGQKVNALSNGTTIQGLTSSESTGEGSVIVSTHPSIFLGFATQCFQGDDDSDGKKDSVEWYENAIQYLFPGVTVQFFIGDPDDGGVQIGTNQYIKIVPGTSGTVSITWSTDVEKYHDIYVHVDRPELVTELSETNNKAFKTILVSSAPEAVTTLAASMKSVSEINLDWNATGDDGFSKDLNNSTFTIQYTSVTAWAEGNSWSTNTASVPAYVYTVEIATTGVTAGSKRFWTKDSLLSNTTYFFRLWTKDDIGRYSALSNGATACTLAEPVTNPQIYKVFYTSVTVNWLPHPASPQSSTCEGYRMQASTASDFTGVIYSSVTSSVNVSTLTIKSLGTNTTYYFRVASLNWPGQTNYILAGSTCTLKPAAGSSPMDPEISAVFMSSMTMIWTQVSSDDGYLVQASTDIDFTGTISSSKTADGKLEILTVSEPSLYTNTTYYLRVGALWGTTTSYAATQVASTLADSIKWGKFNEVFLTSASVTWQALPTSPPDASSKTCEGYRLQASTASDWTGTLYSSSTPSVELTTLTVSGLSVNTTYYFRIGSLNWESVANYLFVGSTPTLASKPLDTSVIAASSYSITAKWTAGDPANPSGTKYILEASSTNFSGGDIFSTTTFTPQGEVFDLMSNTTYYLRPKAVNWAGREAFGITVATSTLTRLIEGAQYYYVAITSVTTNWLEFPIEPSSSSCKGYIVQASTASNFTGEIFSSSTISGVVPSTLTVKDFYSDTIYYFRVGAYNWNYVPNYVSLGSTRTKVAVPPPDLMIANSDIKLDPTEADFGWVVKTSATVRNLSYNFEEELREKQEVTYGDYQIHNGLWQANGFVVSKDMSLMSIEIYAKDYGTTGDKTTLFITTGNVAQPSKGAVVIASTDTTAPTANAWVKFTFNEPVRLQPLLGNTTYWMIAKNSSSADNGWTWNQEDSDVITGANQAESTNQGDTWTTYTGYECTFRIYESSNVVSSFYNGDPDDSGTLIDVSTVAAINTNKTRLSTMSWTAASPEEYHKIYVHVDRANDIGESDETNNKAFNTIAVSSAPDKVTDFTASTNSATSINLKWSATGDDGASGDLNNSTFTIQYTSVTAWAEGNSWNQTGSQVPDYVYTVHKATNMVAGSKQFYIQTNLIPNTTHYFRIWLKDDFGRVSSLSNGATVCTLAAIPETPANPFVVYFSSVSVLWLANGNPDDTEYRLQASTASNFTGDLYGPYVGPNNWFIATSTDVISLLGCTTYYFRVQARNHVLIETDFKVLGSTKTLVYFDCGLRVYDGTGIVPISCMPLYCTGDPISPIRIRKDNNYAIGVVDAADPKASKLKVQTPSGLKSLRKY
ncbi:MAG: hypothetical protein HY796_01025 [Elusimicrobia bacterium]|nr:hypothetical protein [Elusimicrobiota bacterium]